ncbi:HAD family hydrolase [Algoriphagus sanaruensis]|uniref:HAD family hydrolase n=1 Tax=Algoriphagus sanaruensis TaxID=1727163 RepID=A0A142EM43_9BACT|nr:HAD family phosphatase [Algoriphagus sanaruensis]AMQ56198.1 HAD family hydrolase [Algoriphagus sanaruensis]
MSIEFDLLAEVKHVFFDMDGTMVDSIPFHQESWLRFLSNHGIHLRPEEFRAQNHGTIHEMIRRFFPHEKSSQRILELGEEKEYTYRQLYSSYLVEIKGLSSFLEHLKTNGISIHLSTMGDQNNIDFILDGLELRHFFKTITGGHEVFKGKPDPEIFELSLKKAGAKPAESIVFEDSGGGIRAAKAAGLRVLGLATTHSKRELIELGWLAAYHDFSEILNEKRRINFNSPKEV